VLLSKDQLGQILFFRETFDHFSLMLPNPLFEVRRDTRVKNSVIFVRQNMNVATQFTHELLLDSSLRSE